MDADGSGAAVIPSHGRGRLTPWSKGTSGNPGGVSKAEGELKTAISTDQIPQANACLTRLRKRGMKLILSGNPGQVLAGQSCLALWFKVCGLVQKPTDDAKIQETAKALLDGMIAEARARRAGGDDRT